MKINISITLVLLFSVITAFSQTPKSFKYQAVVRDNSGTLLANHIVNFRISLLKGSSTGTAVYVETQKDTTNQFGLANLKIGAGTLVSGNFANINWGGDAYFVKIELDINGLTSFQLMGTSQLLSVPYALYSEKTGSDGIWTKNLTKNYLSDTTGFVGIGTKSPAKSLHVKGESVFIGNMSFGPLNGGYGDVASISYSHSPYTFIVSSTPGTAIALNVGGGSGLGDFYLSSDHNVGIGTTNPGYKLSVNGTIQAKEIIVNTGWSDFVFAKEYRLISLKELEKYINTNKHLPEIPSAKEVEDKGVQLGSISSKLLQKIEELTLYIIELNKTNEQLQKRIEKLENNKINKNK